MKYKSNFIKHIDFVFLDIICLIFSYFFSYYYRHGNIDLLKISIYKETFILIIIVDVFVSCFFNVYDDVLKRGYFVELKTTLIQDLTSFLLIVGFLFTIKASNKISRITLFLTYIVYVFLSYLIRIIYKKVLIMKANKYINKGKKSLLVICNEYKEIENIIKSVSKNNFDGYEINTVCLLNKTKNKCKSINIINIDSLIKYISSNWVDEILITCDFNKVERTTIELIKEARIPLHIKIDILESQVVNKIGNFNVISSINVNLTLSYLFIKRFMDIVGALIGCVIAAIMFVVIGPIIYIKSPGPIIYKSNRVGKNGKIFKFYKFRSMVTNADVLKQSLASYNIVEDGMMFKMNNDPRIIPGIGQFIRKSSIDEFPQFLNVLKGDMSLVGTRPPTPDEWNKYSPYYRSRLSIKPGITGLWQVSGRSKITDFNEIVKIDNEYINNMSISLDIKIILKTIISIINKEGSM